MDAAAITRLLVNATFCDARPTVHLPTVFSERRQAVSGILRDTDLDGVIRVCRMPDIITLGMRGRNGLGLAEKYHHEDVCEDLLLDFADRGLLAVCRPVPTIVSLC